MPDSKPQSQLEADICIQIFSASVGMVGVCLTVIGLVRVAIAIRKVDTIADDLLAMDALLFLISGLASYWAMRRRSLLRMHRVEHFADAIFIAALLMMVAICAFITYAISAS